MARWGGGGGEGNNLDTWVTVHKAAHINTRSRAGASEGWGLFVLSTFGW